MTVTLITGSSSGIGQATALHFARKGHQVFASMRNPEAGGEPLRTAAKDEGLKIELVTLDVDDADSAKSAVQTVLDSAGRIDVLVNNAGVGGGGAFEETTDEEWHAIMETNFHGAVRMTNAVLPGMRARKSGAIVQVTSVAGRIASPPQGAYAASKWALEAASEILAQEVRRFGIRVAIVEPGVIMTPIFAKNMSEPDLNSPYVDFVDRIGRFFAARLQEQAPPSLVAEVIDDALTANPPKLRWPAGWDAEAIVAGRQKMTDEEWVDFGLPQSDEQVAAFFKEKFGIDIG